jgi:hypothetical protein
MKIVYPTSNINPVFINETLQKQSSTLAVVRWPTASENGFGPVTFANFSQQNLYKYSNFGYVLILRLSQSQQKKFDHLLYVLIEVIIKRWHQ